MEKPTGRAAGGAARAAKLTPQRRREIAVAAAAARKEIASLPMATHESGDHPLKIGDVELACYVLEDGTRVLSQRGLQAGIGMSTGGGSSGEQRLAAFALAIADKSQEINELHARSTALAERLKNPIRFRVSGGGGVVHGYEATTLADLCDIILAARTAGKLQRQQTHIADQAELLVRGFARVGIIALVDEATGYQKERARTALAAILEAFIAKELQPWVQTFPTEYYQELFRLRGLDFPSASVKRPQYFGVLTNDIVYKRLAPGVLDELKRVTPRNDDGRPKAKYFQSLTSNKGYPKLREHLGKVIMMMQLSTDYEDFKEKLERFLPKHTDQIPLTLEQMGPEGGDDGRGL